MPLPFTQTDNPELDQLELELLDYGIKIQRWLEYEFNEHYLTPSAGCTFKVAAEQLSGELQQALRPGTQIRVSLNGNPQMTGAIDDVIPDNDRSVGTVLTITARDGLGPLVSGNADPSIKLSEGQTLFDVIFTVASDFGFHTYSNSNEANRNVITGALRGARTTKTGKPLKSFTIHQLKPYPNEGAFAFMSRISQRFGLWIRLSALGDTLILAEPDFDQDAIGGLQRLVGAQGNNILAGAVQLSGTDQPSIVYASGDGGGQGFDKARVRAAIRNPIVDTDISPWTARYPSVQVAEMDPAPVGIEPFAMKVAPPIFLHDDESHDQAQLARYCQRELALRLRKAVTGQYTIKGHTLNGHPVAVDTKIDVMDDRSRWYAPMWCIGRTFAKKRDEQGTRSHLELIPLYTLMF